MASTAGSWRSSPNRLPLDLIARPGIRSAEDMRGRTVGVSSLDAGSSPLVMELFTAHGPEHRATTGPGPSVASTGLRRAGPSESLRSVRCAALLLRVVSR
jgi:hypothetical protein